MKDIICFEVNDWEKYPKFFDEWFDYSENDKHSGENWLIDLDTYAKENKLCIKVTNIDMSVSLTVTAPKNWAIKNCCELFEKEWEEYLYVDQACGYPSGEVFFDWKEENFGAINIGDNNDAWKVINGKIIEGKFINEKFITSPLN